MGGDEVFGSGVQRAVFGGAGDVSGSGARSKRRDKIKVLSGFCSAGLV